MISEKEYYIPPSVETEEIAPEKGLALSGKIENYRFDCTYDNDEYWD